MKSSLPSSPLNPPPLAPTATTTTTTTTDNNLDEQAGDGQAMGRYFLSFPSTLAEPVIGCERLDASPVAPAEPGVAAVNAHDDGTRTEGKTVSQESTGGKTAPAEVVERLRGAVDAQLLLSQQRERLAEQQRFELPTRLPSPKMGRKRVSPILEEDSPPLTLSMPPGGPPSTGLQTASTDSVRTVKGPAMAHTPKHAARTPSYPFPPVPIGTPKSLSLEFHKPFTTLSPTATPSGTGAPGHGIPKDRPISGPATPASTLTFLPSGASALKDSPAYRSPNLYNVTLALNSEPGLDSWWANVVQVMRDDFKADRVTLAVPADTTDLENVPWGQKATFNAAEEDEHNLTYLQREGIEQPSACGTEEQSLGSLARPGFTRKENARQGITRVPPGSDTSSCGPDEKKKDGSLRYSEASRAESKSLNVDSTILPLAGEPPQAGTTQPAVPLPESPVQRITSEQANFTGYSDIPRDRELPGRVLPVLQPLGFEAEPLIESGGIIRVLERSKVVVLSREYTEPMGPTEKTGIDPESQRSVSNTPLTPTTIEQAETTKPGQSMSQASEARPRSLSLLSSRGPRHSRSGSRNYPNDGPKASLGASAQSDEAVISPAPSTMYSEYEQFPSSPWSQSPAPSPAIRSDPAENPFFTDAKVDEESFNPANAPQDYSIHQEVEAIGVDKASTVIHIPLIHPLLSKTHQHPRLNSSAASETNDSASSESTPFRPFVDARRRSVAGAVKDKRTPIAVLSILSPVIPYPSNLVNSLTYLAPHLATSFSLSRHYTNIEAEATGRKHRRHSTAHRLSSGAGGVLGDGRQAAKLSCLEELVSTGADEGCSISINGSVTSPSEYSLPKSSPGGSLVGTPGRDPVSLGLSNEIRSAISTPGFHASSEAVDSYFPSRRRGLSRSSSGVVPTVGGLAASQSQQPSQSPVADRKQTEGPDAVTHHGGDSGQSTRGHLRLRKNEYPTSGDDVTIPKDKLDVNGESAQREGALVPGFRDEITAQKHSEQPIPQRRPMLRAAVNQSAQRPHSFLHSYGADFNATFHSLASTSSVPRNPTSRMGHSRSGSAPSIGLYEMPPPSERLLRTIIDSIPVQIFTAAPQSGTITWVNSRFLTYRGQTVEDFIKAPWQSIHDDDREEYLKLWSQALRNGEQFSHQVRIRRFDGSYRWFYVRAAPLRDTRGLTVHWFGTNMDIHEQHLAEMDLARQKETAASEAKYRALANSSPQIVFAATEGEGITFVNTQWLTYSGQRFRDALSLGFMEHVHPDDLSKCKLPFLHELLAGQAFTPMNTDGDQVPTPGSCLALSTTEAKTTTEKEETTQRATTPNNSNIPIPGLSKLASTGIIKVSRDSEGNPTYSTEVRLRSKEGEYRWHLVRCIIVDSKSFGDGECLWFGTCTDINDHKLLEKKLKETMDSKTRFLSNMSHEIRTPLIGISGMVKFLLDTPLTPEQLDYCHTISTSSEGLLLVINDILDLSKVDAGMMKLSYEWFHIRSLIEDANELLSTMAIQKRLELSYIVDEDVPSVVKGDRVRLRQVLLNIIGNAIKFTSVGEVFSRCQIHHDRDIGSNEIMLSFEVTDTGPGFNEKEAELIFKPFSQIDGSSTRQHGGSGLGLVISRQLVELHGGTLKGSSIEGKGSIFLFTAKFLLPNEQDGPISPTTRPNIGLPGSSGGRPRLPIEQESTSTLRAKALAQPPLPSIANAEHRDGSPALVSSGNSDPPIRSHETRRSERSSMSSITPNSLASIQDDSTIQLAIPPTGTQRETGTPSSPSSELSVNPSWPVVTPRNSRNLYPPVYSILVLSEQPYSREATTRHIATTLPKGILHQITPSGSFVECQRIIGGEDPVIFTHVIVSLSDADEIISLIHQIFQSAAHVLTSIVILSDPLQRAEILQLAPEYDFDKLHKDKRVQFVYKPIKPSRFAAIFDPELERDLSTDRNRSSAERVAESQKQVFVDMERNVGNKGHRVLLVEDNPVNRKVLLKFLGKVGLRVETAVDGMECTDKVFYKPPGYYSLVLCDLHMPRKDGYQTCREIRQWERKNNFPTLPIIALSANVMSDVVDRCVQAGFNSYVTKPVDFKELSKAMTDLLDPVDPMNPPVLLRHS
ncbi:hypothetical protein GP486_004847 [Trichoglossum hirsutum]|uniref:histidine kinase n=1 Tax=Trichoglossum hirsutum TaxID=265104 RepID=A0A9P8RNC2_9PEZI|nr:hypothetical protein GP486_004847 [Trichoglossum hirsutum]